MLLIWCLQNQAVQINQSVIKVIIANDKRIFKTHSFPAFCKEWLLNGPMCWRVLFIRGGGEMHPKLWWCNQLNKEAGGELWRHLCCVNVGVNVDVNRNARVLTLSWNEICWKVGLLQKATKWIGSTMSSSSSNDEPVYTFKPALIVCNSGKKVIMQSS